MLPSSGALGLNSTLNLVILLDDGRGTKRIVRDVVVGSISELRHVIIERSIEALPQQQALYSKLNNQIYIFDDRTQSYSPLSDSLWPLLESKKYIEVRFEARHLQPKRGDTAGKATAPPSPSATATNLTEYDSGSKQQAILSSSAAVTESGSKADVLSSSTGGGGDVQQRQTPRPVPASTAPGGGGGGGVNVFTLRARVVDYVRRSLMDAVRSGSITKDELVMVCSSAVNAFATRTSRADAELNRDVGSLSPSDKDVIDAMLRDFRRAAVANDETGAAVEAVVVAKNSENNTTVNGSPFPKKATANAALDPIRAEAARALGIGSVGAVPPSSPIPQPKQSPTPNAVAATPTNLAHRFNSGATGRLHDDSFGFYDPLNSSSPKKNHHHDNNGRSRASSASVGVGDGGVFSAVPPSILDVPPTFSAVLYSVTGAFPAAPSPPSEGDVVGSSSVRVSLSAPPSFSVDEDVLITAHVVTRSTVVLTWWLAYGANKVTLNMDELYARGCVTTFQVSETGLLLTIRRGTLVAGWDYTVHLTAASQVTGSSCAAQTNFRVSRFAGDVGDGGLSATGSKSKQSRVTPALQGVSSTQHRHLRGYQADEDTGRFGFARVATTVGVDGTVGSPMRTTSGRGDAGESALAQQLDSWAASRPAASQAAPPSQPQTKNTAGAAAATPPPPNNNKNALQQPQGPAASNPYAIGRTFQEQLRAFFLDEVEPLYRLSRQPNMSADEFSGLIRGIAKKYWFSRPASSVLNVQLQHEIIEQVKDEILKRRVEDDRHMSSEVPTVGQRPQFATPSAGRR